MSLTDQQWCPTSVQVTVHQARGLRIKGKSGTNDAYAIMQVGKEKFQTSVVEKCVAPVWKEEAAFDMPPLQGGGGGGTERSTLHVHVLHRALVGPDKLLGQAVINLLQLSEDKTRNKTEWFKLLDKTGKADKDRGEVLVDIQFMRNNMTASMFDLSAAGKSRSRLGKFKDKVRGKKKESDTVSNVVPSFSQVLTDSEEEGNGDGEVAAVKDEKKKKHKMKSLFSPKSNLQKNMSQSMSVLPGKNSSLSGSQSSGLNVDSSEGKKKFKFLKHKRSGSSDSKESSSGSQKHGAAEQSNLCINGSHVYCEEPQPRTSRIGSNYSLASSGHGSMEDVPESSPPSVDSLRVVRQYSPWTEEEEEEVENLKEDVGDRREEMIRMEEERKKKEEEEERVRRQKELERLRQEEEERRRSEVERVKREEEERIRKHEEERVQEARRRQEEEERLKREEEERERLAVEKKRQEEQEMKQREEEERIRMEEERAQEVRRRREEEERIKEERAQEERRRQEEEERIRMEEERRRKEEEERIRMEEERAQEERRRQEEEERIRMEEERAQEERRRQEEQLKIAEEKRRLEEKERKIHEEKARKEEEERIRIEKERAEEERRRVEEERLRRQEEEHEEKRKLEDQERMHREEEERIRMDEERVQEERRRQEEEEKVRREEEKRELEEKRWLEEQDKRQREEEERIRMEEERAQEERRRQEEQLKLEEKRRLEEEEKRMEEEKFRKEEEERKRKEEEELKEKRRLEEEEKMRREDEERIKKEEENAKREKEEFKRMLEEKRKLEEAERKGIEAEEKIRQEEEERIREEEERRRRRRKEVEEQMVRRQEEQKRLLAEQKRRAEEERKQREEEERIKEEKKRRQEEEERARKEKEEHERLVKEKMKQEEEERRRAEEEKRLKKQEEERIRKEEKAEKKRKEDEARKLEKEKLVREAEEQKKKENPNKSKATEQKPKESPAEVISTNPFDENFSDPFDEAPDSPAEPVQRAQSAASLVGSKPISADEKDLNSTQREKRPAPQPPGRSQAERQSQSGQDGSAQHLAQINKKGKEKDIKTVSVLPQRSVQMIAPLSRSPTDAKTQNSATKETSNVAKQGKRHAPPRPRSAEEEQSSEHKTTQSEAKQIPVVYGLNPFEDEDENEAKEDATPSGDAASGQWPPDSQGADNHSASQTKIKSTKARAPPLPAKTAGGDSVTGDRSVTAKSAGDPKSEAPLQESQHATVQSAAEEAGVKKEGPPVAARRLQPVKPLSPLEQNSVSAIQEEKDNKSTEILCEVQQKTKVNDAGLKGPYTQLTREELISLVLKQETQLSERNKKISELELYIDNLLVRVMEESPSILMSLNSMKKAA